MMREDARCAKTKGLMCQCVEVTTDACRSFKTGELPS
jgi:hypothetical protein